LPLTTAQIAALSSLRKRQDALNWNRGWLLAMDVSTIEGHYSIAFSACKNIRESIFIYDIALDISTFDDDAHVLVTSYRETSVRFQLFLGVAANSHAAGRIVYSHQYKLRGKLPFKYLGELTIWADGRKNFTGGTRFISASVDLIVAHFLTKAYENNLSLTE
jgi:hypothetical protein